MRLSLPFVLLPLVLGWFLGGAQAQVDAAAQRQQIAAERLQINERFELEQRQCRQRFAINACLDQARKHQREALVPLQTRQVQLDARERQQRAAARQAAIDQRRQLSASAPPGKADATAAAHARSPRSEPTPPDPATARKRGDAAAAQAKASERAAATRRGQADIQADQARIQARVAKRAAQGKAAAPLPSPAAAGAGSAPT